tara:strand:+ start:222 stop:566 length:345 start_codon:yes stop_codon:yes gene_type:complete
MLDYDSMPEGFKNESERIALDRGLRDGRQYYYQQHKKYSKMIRDRFESKTQKEISEWLDTIYNDLDNMAVYLDLIDSPHKGAASKMAGDFLNFIIHDHDGKESSLGDNFCRKIT